jgi:hypothetical protein
MITKYSCCCRLAGGGGGGICCLLFVCLFVIGDYQSSLVYLTSISKPYDILCGMLVGVVGGCMSLVKDLHPPSCNRLSHPAPHSFSLAPLVVGTDSFILPFIH